MPIKRLIARCRDKSPKPLICPRDKHSISRRDIDPAALKVLYRLSDSGYTAYLVGGGVRDILLGRSPKDFDISTNAHPQQIRRLFRNCFLVGRRFRLAHIRFGDQIIETSTFRRQPESRPDVPQIKSEKVKSPHYQHADNTFGTPSEDASRRDFTVNGLFYDIKSFAVIDYVGGLTDLQKRILRSIGNPDIRFREDPVRMLRAVRFSARLGFSIDRASMRSIRSHYAEILNASAPRLFEEIIKLFGYQSAESAFRLLWETGLMSVLMPSLHAYIDNNGQKKSVLWRYLSALDEEVDAADGASLCMCALLYPLIDAQCQSARTPAGLAPARKRIHAQLSAPLVQFPVPRALREKAGNLFEMQALFDTPPAPSKKNNRLLHHPDFSEALILRRIHLTASGGDLPALQSWIEDAGKQTDSTRSNKPANRKRSRPRKRRSADQAAAKQKESTKDA